MYLLFDLIFFSAHPMRVRDQYLDPEVEVVPYHEERDRPVF